MNPHLFKFNPLHYLFLWLIPLMTAHMFLMRVRGIAEHGLGIQLGVKNLAEKTRGIFYTRSFGTPVNRYPFPFLLWLERFLIGSLNVYYHHEHHLYPKVPYYNLRPKLSEKVQLCFDIALEQLHREDRLAPIQPAGKLLRRHGRNGEGGGRKEGTSTLFYEAFVTLPTGKENLITVRIQRLGKH